MIRTNKRWIVVVLIFLATSINYLDRSVLGVAGPSMMKDLHLDKIQFGVLGSAFFWTYALMQIPVGVLVDKIGPRAIYAVAIIWWSVCSVLTGVVRSFALLIGVRALMGIGESPAFPTNVRVISDWLPSRERGIANGLFTMGIAVGAGLTTPAVAWVVTSFGWETSFFLTGIIGLAWAGLWLFHFTNKPKDNKKVNAAELEHITSGEPELAAGPAVKIRWGQMLRSKNVWAILYGLFAQDYLLYLMLTWLPVYLVTERKMTLITAGFYAILPWVAASIGALLGGYLSDRMIKNGTPAVRARRRVMATGMILSLAIIPAAFVSDQLSAVLLIAASLGGMMFANGASWAIVSEIAPNGASGTLAGMQNFIGNIAGWIAPILTGWIATVTGSFVSALAIAGLIGGASAIVYLVFLKERNEFHAEPSTTPATEGALQ